MQLKPIEQRVLGCLIEKERATPQNYPLTLNSLRLACNQSSNRDPVVDFDEASIDHALSSLREQGFTRIVYSTSNRAAKFRHVLEEALHLGDDELAVLAVLMLRGPQTIGEIKGRTERLFAFADLSHVQATLDRLASREDDAFVRRLERRPGQKDARYIHLLGPLAETSVRVDRDEVDDHDRDAEPITDRWRDDAGRRGDEREPTSDLAPTDARPAPVATPDAPPGVVEDLVVEVARLRDEVDELTRRLDEFRAQFD